VRLTPDGQWHEVVLRPTEVPAGGEHWGGVNDGQWHPPAALLAINIGRDSAPGSNAPSVYVTDVSAEVALPAGSLAQKRILRVLLASDRLGNLLYPDDESAIPMTVEPLRPLPASWRTASFVVRDHYGAEQGPPGQVTLERSEPVGATVRYEAALDLGGLPVFVWGLDALTG
jgi:hypothetical protein